MNRKISLILALLLLLVGLGILIYPTLSDYINRKNGSYVIQDLSQQMEKMQEQKLREERTAAEAYNEKCSGIETQTECPSEYGQIMDFGGGVMGYIQIPEIEVNLPVYHGVEEDVLTKGVGHLPQTAFPIGGTGNHAVLSGHTGLPGAALFTDLTELETGDWFYINVLEETLAYQVDQIQVVEPGDSRYLAPVPGEDLCTLVTCTPYGINSHRLLVRGTRVLQQESIPDQPDLLSGGEPSFPPLLAAAGAAAVQILLLMAVVIFRR